jgi:hypothetical protein
MRSSKHLPIYLWSGLAILIVYMLSLAGTSPVYSSAITATSHFATPLPSPTNNGGNAQWKVNKTALVSNYPKGFDFVIDASSSAGKITKAIVMWRHSTSHPQTMLATINDKGQHKVHWTPLPGRNIPAWVGVDYWWELTDEKGNRYQTPHDYAEYEDTTRAWRRLASEDAVIHWEASLPKDLGAQIAAALKERREFYRQAWGKLLDYKPSIIVYASYEPWQEWNSTIDTYVIEGQTDPYWGGTVQVFDATRPDSVELLTYAVVLHEVEHLYQQVYGAYGSSLTQVWFFEGDATYMELYQPYDYLESVRDLAANGQLPSLQKLSRRTDSRDEYDVGYAFWKYLEVSYGPDTHRKVWEQIGKGQPIVLALQTATGKSLPVLEKEFRKWLGAP